MKNTLFPIFLKTEHLRFLIIGGGNVGLEKASTLLKQNPSAKIKVISTLIKDELKQLSHTHENLQLIEKDFEDSDLQQSDLVIIATDDTELNKMIKIKANAKGILVNAADQPDLCDFYLGSIVNKGHLKIAISTNGKSPVMARRLREYFTAVIPDSIEHNIDELHAIRNQHKGDFNEKLNDLNLLTSSFGEKKSTKKYKRFVFEISLVFFALFIGYALSSIVSFTDAQSFVSHIPTIFYIMLAVGFFAQLVDGAVGLGYGVTCSTSMMIFGVNLPAISGSIHTAEMFSSGISGFSHYKFGNVNKKLLVALAIPGVIGAVLGSLLLVYLGNKYETIAYAVLATYTLIIGIRLIVLAFRKKIERKKVKNVGFLGFSGGFLDAFGGGGWGPIVTSTLLAKGKKSNIVVGTVSLAEFFVTLSASITFFITLGVSHGFIVAGLIIGGATAAPIASKLAGKIPQRAAILAVAFLVIVFSVRILMKIF
ncbi:TSUP family transporter [Algoriella sp.]|uniref:TSUP family transporter n=1 Tax=Algoriella sp. TaxID=1872434 RepID=UPI001B27A7A8|nr:TSUP family transporter [Algoriella sp.]MBO6211830.1 TSUP family transporter [Algoriella sp.]